MNGANIAKPSCLMKLAVERIVALLPESTSKFNKLSIIGFLKPKKIDVETRNIIDVNLVVMAAINWNNGNKNTHRINVVLLPNFSETL